MVKKKKKIGIYLEKRPKLCYLHAPEHEHEHEIRKTLKKKTNEKKMTELNWQISSENHETTT